MAVPLLVSTFSIAQLPTWVITSCMLYIVSLLFLCFKWWQLHPKYGKNIGPPILPMVGSFLSLVKNQNRMYEWATELLRKSPSLTTRNVLFGLEVYTTANPANVEYMLKTNFHNYTKGFRFQGLMEDMLGHGIFNVDGELWKAQRKAASYEFTSSSLKTLMLESVQREIADRLLPVLYGHMCRASNTSSKLSSHKSLKYTSCSAPVDLQDIFLRFAFDNICQISLGVDPGCLNHSREGDSFARAFDDATELIIQRFFTPAWIWQSKRLLNVGSERRLRKALDVVHSFAMNVVKQRKQECIEAKGEGRHQHSDLLFRLLRVATQPHSEQLTDSELNSKASEDKSKFENVGADMKSDELVRDMIISFLLAGRDTSSIALSWFFWLLSQHSHVEAAIYEEIMRVAKASRKGRYACTRKLDFDDDGLASGGSDKEQRSAGMDCSSDNVLLGKDVRKHVSVGDGSPAVNIDEDYVSVEENNSDSNRNIADEKQHMHGDAEGNTHGNISSDDVQDGGGQPAYEAFSYEELKEMRYLQAALQEAMRLYPPVPHDTKLVVEDDVLPDGTRLCAGAQLAYHAYAMGRMESIWGEDWEKFRPERWMEQQGPVSTFKWPVFQAGPRICLGKDMAMLQMKCVAAALIQRFSVTLEEGFGKPRYQLSFTLKMQQGLLVHLHPRRRHP